MSRPGLHLYSLPLALLDNFTPRNLISQSKELAEEKKPDATELNEPIQNDTLKSRTCNICPGAVFANTDVEGHRSHFRTDWHRYNVKAKLASGKQVSERDFTLLVEGLEDSLSGSASSSSEEDDSDSDTVQKALSRTRIQSRSPSPSSLVARAPVTPLAWFHSPPAFQLGVYRAVFNQNINPEAYLQELKDAQVPVPGGRKWTMFMVAGGHFAGLVARVSKASDATEVQAKKGIQKVEPPEVEILLHKTFHRYTTRRKQGGSQSLNDQAKGNAKSAGALLRRYGEQALRDDIRNLISEWAEEINSSERIWMRASGANRRIFVDYDESIIAKGDERLRTFPFPTRRPTQAELSRCLLELTRVKTSNFTEEELQQQDEEYLASLPKPKPKPAQPPEIKAVEKKAAPPKLTKEEEAFRDKWLRLIDMVRKGRLDRASEFWEREGTALDGVDATIPSWAGEKMGTLLQLASSAGKADIVAWLLDELNADPTIPVPSLASRVDHERDGKGTEESGGELDEGEEPGDHRRGGGRTAYDVASNKDVRDTFRRSAGLRPDAWDWLGAAHIPSVLTADMEAEREKQNERRKDRRKGLRDKVRAREKAAQAESRPESPVAEVETEPPGRFNNGNKTGPQKLGGAAHVSEGLVGLSSEMQARVERERRARAAMARMRPK